MNHFSLRSYSFTFDWTSYRTSFITRSTWFIASSITWSWSWPKNRCQRWLSRWEWNAWQQWSCSSRDVRYQRWLLKLKWYYYFDVKKLSTTVCVRKNCLIVSFFSCIATWEDDSCSFRRVYYLSVRFFFLYIKSQSKYWSSSFDNLSRWRFVLRELDFEWLQTNPVGWSLKKYIQSVFNFTGNFDEWL